MRESLTEKYNRLYIKYSRVGCPAARYEDNCAHPDLCAENGRCVDLGPHPMDKEASDGSPIQEK